MVTKLDDGRGQTTLKGKEITAEWENLVRKAAERAQCTVAKFVTDHTTAAAQAIIKSQPVGPVALPVRLEDIATNLQEHLDRISAEQRAFAERLLQEQAERMAPIERLARRARWRR